MVQSGEGDPGIGTAADTAATGVYRRGDLVSGERVCGEGQEVRLKSASKVADGIKSGYTLILTKTKGY